MHLHNEKKRAREGLPGCFDRENFHSSLITHFSVGTKLKNMEKKTKQKWGVANTAGELD